MSPEENKAVVHRLVNEGFNLGDLDVVEEVVAHDAVGHAYPDEIRGPDGVKAFITTLRGAFPDLRIEIADLIAQDDRVVARWVARGTHEGELRGIPPTGTEVEFTGITIERIEGGEIVEGWTNRDFLGLLRQIGVVPRPDVEPEARP